MKYKHLAIKQLDEQLKDWANIKKQAVPQKGWINLIRSVLGISTRKLAMRMGVSQSRIVHIEDGEMKDTLTIKSLKKAAEAMNCFFVYGIVPKESLREILKNQAMKVAGQQLDRVNHSMSLEDQKIESQKQKGQLEELTKELLDDDPKKLWDKE
jgi:predicted DNA-binding mobile mystery protein A